MSTSIFYNNLGLTLASRIPNSMVICNREIPRVKRVLFEPPPDPASTKKFVQEELQKIKLLKSEKWNFDFDKEKTLHANGTYQWILDTPQKNIRPMKVRPIPAENIEKLYGEPPIIAPTPIITKEEEMKSPPKPIHKAQSQIQNPQRLITDYMKEKKRSASEPTNKVDFATMERPAKLQRLQNYKS